MTVLTNVPARRLGTNGPAANWPGERPAYESLAACVQGEASRWNVPGIAVGVLQDGHIDALATGVTNVETRQPVTADTIFQIGSISKVFTATLAMQLVEDGTLDLDTPVVSYLPDLPLADDEARSSLTLRHLFSHTGGFEGDRFIDYGRGNDALTRAIAEFGTLHQWTPPGDLFSYCNAGFYLAGRVIEAVTGQPFETVIRERLFDPMGLERTVFFPEEAITFPVAIGHHIKDRNVGHTIARPYSFPRMVNPAGGIVSSVSELLRFATMHMNDGMLDGRRILSVDAAQVMREPYVDAGDFGRSYGIGWSIWDLDGIRMVDHGGATRGFRSHLSVIPERGFAIAQLTNGEAGSRAMQEIETWALEHYRGIVKSEAPLIELGKKQLDALTGTYERHDGRFEVSRTGKRLQIALTDIDEETNEVEGERSFDLDPVGERRFRVAAGPSTGSSVDFIDLPNGEGGQRALMRMWGRLSERTTPVESSQTVSSNGEVAEKELASTRSDQKDKKAKKGKKGKKAAA